MFEIALNGSLDKFLTRISLHLPKEALNALRKYNLESERTFETPCSISINCSGYDISLLLSLLYSETKESLEVCTQPILSCMF